MEGIAILKILEKDDSWKIILQFKFYFLLHRYYEIVVSAPKAYLDENRTKKKQKKKKKNTNWNKRLNIILLLLNDI